MTQKIQLSDHFTYSKLIRFTLPSILMMIFISIYGVVDGVFVSNFVGKTAFASLNLIYPFLQILSGLGAMLGVGGSALVAKTLGEQDTLRASRYFSMMIYLMVILGLVCTVLGIVFMEPVARLLGATDAMVGDCVTYGRICMLFSTFMHAQYTFQSYLIVAERPKLGLLVTVLAGVSNMVLDYLFMAVLKLGIAGAALATGMSQMVGGLIPFLWFMTKGNTSALRYVKTKFEIRTILRACGNGASEMLTSVSASITGLLYNLQLMTYAGEDGVAAYGVVMYAAFIFLGIFAGYCQGSSPIMGYHYGAQDHAEMKNLKKRSMILLGTCGVVCTGLAIVLARPISSIFVGYDPGLLDLTTRAFSICAVPFLFMWLNMYASSPFTALNDGVVSAAISFIRSLLLPVICILTLPLLWQLDGVWFSLVGSEVLAVFVSLWFLLTKRKKYGY